MSLVAHDLRHAIRSLRKSPGFTLVAVITLALGIGATAALFTVLDAVVLRPLPYHDAGRLVKIESSVSGATEPGDWGVSAGGYFYYQKHNHTLAGLGAYAGSSETLTGADGAQRVPSVLITASLTHVLGLHAQLGRLLAADDDRPGAPFVAVLRHDFWLNHFAGDPHVVGQTITVNAQPM